MDIYNALAEPNRRRIIELLATSGRLTATDISDRFDVSKPAVSQHLKVLREAKLVDMEKAAQKRIYTINTNSIQEIEDWAHKMKTLWSKRFDRLDDLLKQKGKSK